jgi:DNA-binding transcriptional MerR regulator
MSVHTLRLYERKGLFASPVRRAENGHRLYSSDHIEWLKVCSSLRSSGMPLAEIRRYARLVREGDGNEAERLDLLRRHKERISERVEDLERSLALISWKVGVYEERVASGDASGLWTGANPDDP